MSGNIGKMLAVWLERGREINFVMSLVYMFLLTGNVGAVTVYGEHVLIFVFLKAPPIVLKLHKSIYTGVLNVWSANLKQKAVFFFRIVFKKGNYVQLCDFV
jgi:hypothetical protein